MRDEVAHVTDQLIEYIGSLDDAAGLEWVAAKLGLGIADPAAPSGVPAAIIESLEMRHGTQGLTLLAAIAQVCPGKAAEMAEAGAMRLRQRGIRARMPAGLGEHGLDQAQLEKRDDRIFHAFLLRRPGVGSVEIGFFSTRLGEREGTLREGMLTRPMPEDEADTIMRRIEADAQARGQGASISAEDLAMTLRRASAITIELEGYLEFELWFALKALARAVAVDQKILPAARHEPRRQKRQD
ncbi:MAG: hypothetical protein WBM00_00220 [Solirubrobacterales bacterium]